MSGLHQSSSMKRKLWNPSYDYKVDYNDHFETPKVAYQDILPLLDGLKFKRKTHILYDPYYCNGKTAILLRELGFDNVIHAKRDFYKDIEQNKVPTHDTLVTNPPYSESHKEKCVEFCIDQMKRENRPFFLLMPNYVAAKNYYRRLIHEKGCTNDVAYLAPSSPYEYEHPEGTGKEIPPFNSLWFVGIGEENIVRMKELFKSRPGGPTFLTSLEELEEQSIISTQRRPNPKQRKKRRGKSNNTHAKNKESKPVATKKPKKTSKYRGSNGERIRKRF